MPSSPAAAVAMIAISIFCVALGSPECLAHVSSVTVATATTVNMSCPEISLTLVTFTHSSALIVPLDTWLRTAQVLSPSLPSLHIVLDRVTLLEGACIVFDAQNITASSSVSGGVIITITQLNGSVGGLVFKGAFPANTSILVKDSEFTINASSPNFSFVFPKGGSQSMSGKGIALVNVTLSNASTFTVINSSFFANVDVLYESFPLYIGDSGGVLTLTWGSVMVLQQLTMMRPAGANTSLVSSTFLGAAASILVRDASRISFVACSIAAIGDLLVFNDSVTVTSGSVFSMDNSVLDSQTGQGFVCQAPLAVSNMSFWIFRNSSITAYNDAIYSTGQRIENSSTYSIDGCFLISAASPKFNSGAAMEMFSLVVDVQSQWVMRDTVLDARQVPGHLANHGLLFGMQLQVSDGSSLIWENCNLSSADSVGLYLAGLMTGTTITNQSSIIISRCIIRGCLAALDQEQLTISQGSLWMLSDTILRQSDIFEAATPIGLLTVADMNMTNESVWMAQGCIAHVSSSLARPVSAVQFGRIFITHFSSLIFKGANLSSSFSSAINLSLPMTIEAFSTLQINSSTLSAPNALGIVVGLAIYLIDQSIFSLASCIVSCRLGIQFRGVFSALTNSWVLVSENNVTIPTAYCIYWGAGFFQGTGSIVSFLDNNCTAMPLATPWFGFPSSVLAGTFFTRCNRYQGLVSDTLGFPTSGTSTSPCTMCSSVSDCFMPLTQQPASPFFTCGIPCVCNNTVVLTSGARCLPKAKALLLPPLPTASPPTTNVPMTTTFAPRTTVPSTGAPGPTHVNKTRTLSPSPIETVARSLTSTSSGESRLKLTSTFAATAGSASRSEGGMASISHTISVRSTKSQSWTKKIDFADAAHRPAAQSFAMAASFAAAFVLPASAFAVQRSVFLGLVAQCGFASDQPLDLASSPTTLVIGDGAENGFLRGAVAGNWLLWLGFIFIAGAVCCLYSLIASKRLLDTAEETLNLPGTLISPFSFLLQPTAMASLTLVISPARSLDIIFGVASMIFLCVICGLIALQVSAWFGSRSVPARSARDSSRGASAAVVDVLNMIFLPKREWVDRGSRRFTTRYRKIFEACTAGRQWFAAYEVLYSLAIGLLGGVTTSNPSLCRAMLIVSVLLALLYILLLLSLRPYDALFDQIVALTGGVLNLAAGVEALFLAGDAAVNATNIAVQVASVLSVVLVILQLVLVKLLSAICRGRRRRGSANAAAIGKGNVELGPETNRDPDGERQASAADTQRAVILALTSLIAKVLHDEGERHVALHRRQPSRAVVQQRLADLIVIAAMTRRVPLLRSEPIALH